MNKYCWQYLIKLNYAKLYNDIKLPNIIDSLEIIPISFNEAKTFILNYEWLGNMGASKYCYGLYINGMLASSVCFSSPVSPRAYSLLLGEEYCNKVLQLSRGATAFWAPPWAASKIISYALKKVSSVSGVFVVVAYADPAAGEIGTVYQATNAKYVGLTSAGGAKRYIINGVEYHPRTVYRKFGTRAHNRIYAIDPDYKTVPINPKHRYFYILGPRGIREIILTKLKPHILPYPKRDVNIPNQMLEVAKLTA